MWPQTLRFTLLLLLSACVFSTAALSQPVNSAPPTRTSMFQGLIEPGVEPPPATPTGLTPELRERLAQRAASMQTPIASNVPANDSSGDPVGTVQSNVVVEMWGRFAVAAWVDYLGVSVPNTTYIGWAYSCDAGATWTDGGSMPTFGPTDQVLWPWLARDERGIFYMAAEYYMDNNGDGAYDFYSIGAWAGRFDSTNCTFSWDFPGTGGAQVPVSSGEWPSYPRMVVDDDGTVAHVAFTHFKPPTPNGDRDVRYMRLDSPEFPILELWLNGPTVISGLTERFPQNADIALGPGNRVHVTYESQGSGVYYCNFSNLAHLHQVSHVSSPDQGVSWGTPSVVAATSPLYFHPAQGNLWGYGPQHPRIAVDRSGGAHDGNIYVTWPEGSLWPAPASGALGTILEIAEPLNNTGNQGQVLPFGWDAAGSAAGDGDTDFYKVSLAAGQTMYARVEAQGEVCGVSGSSFGFSLGLFPVTQASTTFPDSAFAYGSWRSATNVLFTARVAGEYLLRVRPNTGGSTGITYTLRTREISRFSSGADPARDDSDIMLAYSSDGGVNWSNKVLVNHDAPSGFAEDRPFVDVDQQGHVRVFWLDERESETEPRMSKLGRFSDLYMSESVDGGATFGTGQRLSTESSLYGSGFGAVSINIGIGNKATSHNGRVMVGWPDERLSARSTTSIDAMTAVLDIQAPTIELTTAPAESSFTDGTNLTFEWAGSDAGGTGTLTYAWRIDGGPFTDVGPATSVVLPGPLTEGWRLFEVQVTDAGSNSGIASRGFFVDRTPPETVILVAPAEGSTVSTPVVDIQVAVVEAVTPGDLMQVRMLIDGNEQILPLDAGLLDLSLTDLAPGSHQVAASAIDGAGLEDATPDVRNFTYLLPSPVVSQSLVNDDDAIQFSWERIPADANAFRVDLLQITPGAPSDAMTATAVAESVLTSVEVGDVLQYGITGPYAADDQYLLRVAPSVDGGATYLDPSAYSQPAIVDLAPPVTVQTGGIEADSYTNSPTVVLNWDAADNYSTPSNLAFQRVIDGDPSTFDVNVFSETVGDLQNGLHNITVLARDEAGNVESPGLSVDFWVDMNGPSQPQQASVGGGPGAGDVVTTQAVDFLVASIDNLAPSDLLEWSFARDGDPNDWTPYVQSDSVNSSNGYSYYAFTAFFDSDGSHSVSVRVRDPAGNVSTQWSRQFTVQAMPPVLSIDSGPEEGGFTGSTTTFEWSATSAAAPPELIEFAYRLDGAPYSTYSTQTSVALTDLAEGPHTFELRVRDNVGLEDSTSRSFTADLTEPNTSIVQGPPEGGWVGIAGTSVGWSGTDNLSPVLGYEHRIDGGAWSAVTVDSSTTLDALAAGTRTFEVRAQDLGGNVESSPASRSFEVDLQAPETQITTGPAEGEVLTSADIIYAWSGSDDRTAPEDLLFSFRLDTDPFSAPAAGTGTTLSNLPDGQHAFEVRALDLAQNPDESPATRSFVIDRQPPVLAMVAGPAAGSCTNALSVTFEWTASDVVSPPSEITYSYRLDGGAFTPFDGTTSVELFPLPGPHAFTVQARDPRGNLSSISRAFIVDRLPPVANAPLARVLDNYRFQVSCTATDANSIGSFDIEIAEDPDFNTIVLSTSVGPAGTLVYDGTPGHAYYARCRAIDCAGNVGFFSGPSNGAVLNDLPDLVVTNVTAVDSSLSGTPLQVTWSVEDQGLGGTNDPEWRDRVYLSPTVTFDPGTAVSLGEFDNLTFLNPGETYNLTVSVTPEIGLQGDFYLLVETDAGMEVDEADGTNNIGASLPIHLGIPAAADLEVTTVTASPTAFSSDQINISWTVQNNGDGRTNVTEWFDTIFLSSDATFDFTLPGSPNSIKILERPLGNFLHSGELDVGEAYVRNTTVQLPNDISGTYYVFVYSDIRGTFDGQVLDERGLVFEDLRERNFTSSNPISVTQRPPSNLTVTNVFAPTQAGDGALVDVNWTVRNAGPADAREQGWIDRVYLSTDATFDPATDILQATVPRSGQLLADQQYGRSAQISIPNGTSGSFHVFVQTDATDAEPELDETDNATAAASPMVVTLQPWPDLVVDLGSNPASVTAGASAGFSWSVRNAGAQLATGKGREDVYISTNSTWNPSGAIRLGGVTSRPTLYPSSSHTGMGSFRVPTGISGTYYVYVLADANNQVFENSDEGNNVSLIGSMSVAPYPLVDLAVTSPGAPGAAQEGDQIQVSWTVTNIGQAATLASSWNERVYLSTDAVAGGDQLVLQTGHGGAVGAGQAYSRSVPVQLPQGVAGTYYVVVETDPSRSTGDGNLANNVAIGGPIVIAPVPPPDLTVSAVTAPPGGTSGQPITVDYTVNNIGTGAVPTGLTWSITAYLSVDAHLDQTDVVLGTWQGPDGLAAASSQSGSIQVELPIYASGPYYVLVKADSRPDVYEDAAEFNNVGPAAAMTVTLPPPADLVVTDVVPPPTAEPGKPATVQFTLLNQGTNPAVGQLRNAVYVSPNATFEPNDPLLGVETTTINIPPGATRTFAVAVSIARPAIANLLGDITDELPPLSPGQYHAIVRADIRNNIRELELGNNLAVSATQLTATIPIMTIGTPEAGDMAAGDQRFYRVDVGPDLDLRFDLSSADGGATHEAYVAFGRAPDPVDFDFRGPPTLTAEPSVLVPGTQAGSYFIMLRSLSTGGPPTVGYSLLATTLPFGLTSVSPSVGGKLGTVTTRLSGAGLRDTTGVTLRNGPTIVAMPLGVKLINTTELDVTWDLSGVPEGTYDVVAVNGEESSTLAAAFTVERGMPLEIETVAREPEAFRSDGVGYFDFTYRNSSNRDVPYLRVRLLYPAQSELRTLIVDPRLKRRSDLNPEVHEELADDSFVLMDDASGDSLEAVDLVAVDLPPGAALDVRIGLANFVSSPYSVMSLVEPMTCSTFLWREMTRIEDARVRLAPQASLFSPDAAALIANPEAFRDSALNRSYVATGLISAAALQSFLTSVPAGVIGTPLGTDRGPAGPVDLLAELIEGEPCVIPSVELDCTPDVAPLVCTLPACRAVYPTDVPYLVRLDLPVSVALARGSVQEFSRYECATARVVASCDPNELTGPAGVGDERWVGLSDPLAYRVDFENLAEVASAPAQVVDIRVPVDPGLDLATFRLGSFGFGTHTIDPPANRSFYQFEAYFADLDLNVRVTAGIDVVNGQAFWTFSSIDPATGSPPTNPYVGFLPVNDPSGRGQGFAHYTILPDGSNPSGTPIRAQAAITFDTNAPILTGEASNTLDAALPSSAVLPAVDVFDTTRVRVRWAGDDDPTGAGIVSYSLYMQQDTAPFQLVMEGLTETELELPVDPGHNYGFYTRARDLSGNEEPEKTTADVVVEVGTVVLGLPGDVPLQTALHGNTPNPFSERTLVRFDLAQKAPVSLEIFDVQGRVIMRPIDDRVLEPGQHTIEIARLPHGAGVYFYRLQTLNYSRTRKMILLR